MTGHGLFYGPGGRIDFTASGTRAGDGFDLTLFASGYESCEFEGVVGDGGDTMNGRLNGSGFVDQPLVLSRSSTTYRPPRTSTGGGRSCCRVCTTGKACGNSCIARSSTCHAGPGCACNG